MHIFIEKLKKYSKFSRKCDHIGCDFKTTVHRLNEAVI